MLKLSYESKDDIPSGAESFYTEKDGVFSLQAEGVKSDADVDNIKNALDKERKLRRDAESKVSKYSFLPDDFDADQFNQLKDKSLTAGEIDAKLKEQRESITKQHQKELEKYQTQLAEKENLVTTHVKNAELRKAMAEANISKAFMPAVEAMLASKIKVEGTDVFLDEKPVSQALKEWASTDDGKHYVAATANSGGGAEGKGSSTAKTITRTDFDGLNDTQRMEAVKSGVKITE